MENEHKKSKISLSKPEDIPQTQQNYEYDGYTDNTSYQQDRQPYQQDRQPYQQSQPQQTMYQYQKDNARRLPKYQAPPTYQQTNPPMTRNSPFQNSNYARTQQHRDTKFCKYCGSTISFDAVVCPQCGRQVEMLQGGNYQQNNYQQNNTYINNMNVNNNNISGVSNKSRSVAGVLCAIGFFGCAGLHRLYTGHILSGLLYMFTYGLCGIGTIVDLIKLLQGNFTDKNGRLLKD